MGIEIRQADFRDATHCAGIVDVIDSYAADPVGGGRPLSADVRTRLVSALRDHPAALVLLAFADERPVGVALCFFGFSSFAARPLLNIHDLAVVPEWRGRGIGRALLSAVEGLAVQHGCCKLTLEVRDDNRPARTLYERSGFTDFVLEEPTPTRFLCKPLATSDPFVGTWELDPSTPDYQFGRPGRRATYTIAPVHGGLFFSLDGVDADGKPLKVSYGGELNGADRTIAGGAVLVLTRVDERCIESVLKRDGRVVDRWMRVLQPDESAITITQHGVRPDGSRFRNVSVYRRVWCGSTCFASRRPEVSMAKYGTSASKNVKSAMRRRKKGTLESGSGRKVKGRKQAIAIGLSEAREKGAKVPPRKSSRKTSRKASGSRATKKR